VKKVDLKKGKANIFQDYTFMLYKRK